MQGPLEYRGSFRYLDRRAVDEAIDDAAEQLEDDGIHDLDRAWMGYLLRRGTVVHVDAILPATADRHVAAAILAALARHAIEGCVDVRRGGHVLDAFAPEGGR